MGTEVDGQFGYVSNEYKKSLMAVSLSLWVCTHTIVYLQTIQICVGRWVRV
jgi:hypothetical protein